MTGDASGGRASFDRAGFYAALDITRQKRGMYWQDVARETGTSQSTFTRLGQGRAPDVDTFAVLVAWLGMPADTFIIRASSVTEPEPVAAMLIRFRQASGLDGRASAAFERVVLTMYDALRDQNQTARTDAP